MYNFKSVFNQTLNEPIVVSFNKGQNKNYRFGFSINQEDSDFDRSVVVLEDNIYWKSDLSQEISTTLNGSTTTIRNCGDKIFNEWLHIVSDTNSQDINVHYTVEEKTIYTLKSQYRFYPFLNLEEVDTKHSAFITFAKSDYTPTDKDVILNHKDKYYIQKDFKISPVSLKLSKTFVNSYIFEQDDYLIRIDDSGELTLLVTDYEIEINPNEEKVTSIVTMEEKLPVQIYYDRIKTDNVRFTISNYGKLFSLSQFTENTYKDPLIMVFSEDKYKNTESVSVRTGFDHYNLTFDVTANF